MLTIIIITAYHLYADNSNHETTAEVNTNDRLKFLGIEDAGFNCVNDISIYTCCCSSFRTLSIR